MYVFKIFFFIFLVMSMQGCFQNDESKIKEVIELTYKNYDSLNYKALDSDSTDKRSYNVSRYMDCITKNPMILKYITSKDMYNKVKKIRNDINSFDICYSLENAKGNFNFGRIDKYTLINEYRKCGNELKGKMDETLRKIMFTGAVLDYTDMQNDYEVTTNINMRFEIVLKEVDYLFPKPSHECVLEALDIVQLKEIGDVEIDKDGKSAVANITTVDGNAKKLYLDNINSQWSLKSH